MAETAPRKVRANTTAQQLARGLGWFSLALGATELLFPGAIRQRTGLPGPKAVLPVYGVREIATGLAILSARRPVGMVWGRVAGDVLDVLTALPALRRQNEHRPTAEAALGFLLLATAADVVVAMQGDDLPLPEPRRVGTRLNTRPADLPADAAPANRLQPLSTGIPASAGA
jgi:hypothetical protein